MGGDRSLFKNKYRIPSARLKGWDYSSRGWYFITINIKNKEWLFGEVIDNEMRFNEYGQIVREEWEKSFQIRRELICRTYIIMPDHIHGLVGIVELDGNDGNWGDGFKSAATKRINEMRNTPGEPVWQARFYDRIIRDEREFLAIQQDIDLNPGRCCCILRRIRVQ